MTTIPARLAKAAQVSHSLAHAQSRARSLYRSCYRAVSMRGSLWQVPEICALYPLDVPPALLRAKIRTMFERNRHITDVAILDVMLHKGYQEYQETVNAWKQTPHVMKWFAEEEAPGTLTDALTPQPSPRPSWRSSMLPVTRAAARRTRACSAIGQPWHTGDKIHDYMHSNGVTKSTVRRYCVWDAGAPGQAQHQRF